MGTFSTKERNKIKMPLVLAEAAKAAISTGDALAPGYESIGAGGEQALWIAFFALGASTIYFMFGMFAMPDGQRKFHIYTMAITGIATIAYLTMASGGGNIGGKDGVRQFFYARYLDWALTTPLQLLDDASLLFLLLTDFLMIVAGLIGALAEGQV